MWLVVRRLLDMAPMQRRTLATASILAVLMLGYFAALSPRYAALDEIDRRRATLASLLANEKRSAQLIPERAEEMARIEEQRHAALRAFSGSQDVTDLLRLVADKARDAGLEVVLLRPEREEEREFLVESPVLMSVEGTFHQIVTFFDALSRMPQVANVRSFELSHPRSSARGMLVKADFSIVTFRTLTAAEPRSHYRPAQGR